MNKIDLLKALNARRTNSAWTRGVLSYALEIVDDHGNGDIKSVDDVMNYRRDKNESLYSVAYMQSHGGCFEIYDEDIAERLCSPSEIKKCTRKDGSFRDMANARESWLDVQARAVCQAYRMIHTIIVDAQCIKYGM